MSVRAIYGARMVTGTPLQSSGFNGFPFPDILATPPQTNYPFDVTRQRSKHWRDRVSEWTLTTDIEISNGVDVVPLSDALPLIQTSPPADEIELKRFTTVIDWQSNAFSSPYSITNAFNFGQSIITDGHEHTSLAFGAEAVVTSGLDELLLTTQNLGGHDGTITGTIDGESFTMYYFLLSGWSLAGTQWDITATAWWPYAARDASPIYDTATGAQLQDPTN